MVKKIATLFIIAALAVSCQSNGNKEAGTFSQELTGLQDKYDERIKTVKSRAEYETLIKDRNKEFEDLLKKYEAGPKSDELEILRSKALINLGKLDEAEKKIDGVIQKKSASQIPARMVKLQILFNKRQTADALKIFKEIEDKVDRDDDLFNAYLYFSYMAEDLDVKENYANKFLNATDVPEKFAQYKPGIYSVLAGIAKDRGQLEKAEEYLKKAVSTATDPRQKEALEGELTQLQFIGNPAPAIAAETWVNSPPLSLESLKGKVVIVDFWATWCGPCRQVMPVLVEQYNQHKDKGLVVIGFTKLYGSYRDDQGDKGKVGKDEEISLVKEFLNRYQITYPAAISNEGAEFDTYKISGIPTMIFIDKEGKVAHIEIGAGNPQSIRDRIKKLLEV